METKTTTFKYKDIGCETETHEVIQLFDCSQFCGKPKKSRSFGFGRNRTKPWIRKQPNKPIYPFDQPADKLDI